MSDERPGPPMPDEFRPAPPAPARGPLRRVLRWVVDRLVRWRVDPLERSVGDLLHREAVRRREEVAALEARIRVLEGHGAEARLRRLERGREEGWGTRGPAAEATESSGDDFVFGLWARGDSAALQRRAGFHLDRLEASGPVLDLGCGRGDFLVACRERGLSASGVERDPSCVAACRELDLDVDEGELSGRLAAEAPGSLGLIAALHVLEHLPPATLPALLELAASRLRPGGLLLAELPNPTSLAGLVGFFADPGHRSPLHPDTAAWLLRQAGYVEVDVVFLDPVPSEGRLAGLRSAPSGGDADAWARVAHDLALVDERLFGHLSFAVTGRRGGTA